MAAQPHVPNQGGRFCARVRPAKLSQHAPDVQARVHPVAADMRLQVAGAVRPRARALSRPSCPTSRKQTACRLSTACGSTCFRTAASRSTSFIRRWSTWRSTPARLTGVSLGRHLSTRVWRVRGPLRCESYDTVRQVVHSQHRDEECAADGVLRRTAIRIELAYLYPAHIRRELARGGVADMTIAGGFSVREFS
jgi:hypothetical protein